MSSKFLFLDERIIYRRIKLPRIVHCFEMEGKLSIFIGSGLEIRSEKSAILLFLISCVKTKEPPCTAVNLEVYPLLALWHFCPFPKHPHTIMLSSPCLLIGMMHSGCCTMLGFFQT